MSYNEFIIGKRQRLSWVKETSFGAGGDLDNGKVVGYDATISPTFSQGLVEILNDGAGKRTISKKELGVKDLAFELSFKITDFEFMKYTGYEFTNVVAGSFFTHEGTLKNYIQSFLLEWVIKDDFVLELNGCAIASAIINFTKSTAGSDALISVSLSCIAKDITKKTTKNAKITKLEKEPYHFRHSKITIDNNEVLEINNGSIEINQGISADDSRYCSSELDRTIGELIPKVHRLSGNLSINIKDDTYFDNFETGEEIANTSIEFKIDNDNFATFGLVGFRIENALSPLNLEEVYSTDIVWTCNELEPSTKDNINY